MPGTKMQQALLSIGAATMVLAIINIAAIWVFSSYPAFANEDTDFLRVLETEELVIVNSKGECAITLGVKQNDSPVISFFVGNQLASSISVVSTNELRVTIGNEKDGWLDLSIDNVESSLSISKDNKGGHITLSVKDIAGMIEIGDEKIDSEMKLGFIQENPHIWLNNYASQSFISLDTSPGNASLVGGVGVDANNLVSSFLLSAWSNSSTLFIDSTGYDPVNDIELPDNMSVTIRAAQDHAKIDLDTGKETASPYCQIYASLTDAYIKSSNEEK